MTKKDFLKFADDCYEKQMQVNKSKCHDYATDDVLSNFKRVAEICKLWNINVHTPEGVAMFFIIHKLDRNNNLKLKKDISCESIEDTMVLDLPNYIRLHNAILRESSQNSEHCEEVNKISLHKLCNLTKIDKKISTKIVRGRDNVQ